jgi:hypothetical protein
VRELVLARRIETGGSAPAIGGDRALSISNRSVTRHRVRFSRDLGSHCSNYMIKKNL